MLYKIYKACFVNDEIKQAFINDWYWVYDRLWMEEEEQVPNDVLKMVILWLKDKES